MPSTPAETARVPGPSSLIWRYAGDWRGVLLSRVTLLLQVAHPVVGAGVADHSEFLRDRWGRLTRTLESTTAFLGYRGAGAAVDEAARLRELHRGIKGVDAEGRRYHALNPEAYLWVHATLLHAMVETQRRYARRPIPAADLDRLYDEWRDVARMLGITERHIPADFAAFQTYFDTMVADRLEFNDTVRLLLRLDRVPLPPPPGWRPPDALWTALAVPPTALLRWHGLAALPPVLRERFGLRWTRAEELRSRALVEPLRALDRVLPERARYGPLAAKAMRDAAGGNLGAS